jgi:hypothetical protein
MRFVFYILCLFCFFQFITANYGFENHVLKNEDPKLCKNVIGIINPQTNLNENYIFDQSIYQLKVCELPQIKFWLSIMNLSQDSAILCFHDNREIIQKISILDWNSKSDSLKKMYKDSVRLIKKIDTNNRILITSGKKFFYDFEKTSKNFHQGINCFVSN